MERLKAYKFRIYPTEEQEIFFAKSFGCVRKAYNLMLDDRIKAYEEIRKDSFRNKNLVTLVMRSSKIYFVWTKLFVLLAIFILFFLLSLF